MTETEELLAEVRTARELTAPDRARTIRRSAGITQARMAEALGVDRTTLARWETGAMRPRTSQRARWQHLLAELQREVAA